MSLPHALLTSLLEKPCTGAELARRFEKSIGHFWHATHQQIYKELGKLVDDGFLEAQALAAGRGMQRRYEVRPEGRAELERWTALAVDPRPFRDELLVRLRASAVLGTVELLPELRRHEGHHRQSLERYLLIEARDFPAEKRRSRQDELQHAVLRAGILFEESWLAWCAEALATDQRE